MDVRDIQLNTAQSVTEEVSEEVTHG